MSSEHGWTTGAASVQLDSGVLAGTRADLEDGSCCLIATLPILKASQTYSAACLGGFLLSFRRGEERSAERWPAVIYSRQKPMPAVVVHLRHN